MLVQNEGRVPRQPYELSLAIGSKGIKGFPKLRLRSKNFYLKSGATAAPQSAQSGAAQNV